MSTPSFSDFDKNIRELLNTGYNYGKQLINLNLSKTTKAFEIVNNYNLDYDDSILQGESTAKLKILDYGVLAEKWDTNGTLSLQYTDSSRLLEGLDLIAGISHKTNAKIPTILIGTKFANDFTNISGIFSSDLDVNNIAGVIQAVIAVKYGFLGYEIGYDTAAKVFTKSEIGVGCKYKNIELNLKGSAGIGDDYGGSVSFRVNKQLDTALTAGVTSPSFKVRNTNDNLIPIALTDIEGDFVSSIGARYKVNDDCTVRLRMDNNLQLCTSLQHTIYEGIRVTLAARVDANDPLAGSHKVGLTVDVDA